MYIFTFIISIMTFLYKDCHVSLFIRLMKTRATDGNVMAIQRNIVGKYYSKEMKLEGMEDENIIKFSIT